MYLHELHKITFHKICSCTLTALDSLETLTVKKLTSECISDFATVRWYVGIQSINFINM